MSDFPTRRSVSRAVRLAPRRPAPNLDNSILKGAAVEEVADLSAGGFDVDLGDDILLHQDMLLHAMVKKVDSKPRPMPLKEVKALGDYFTQNILLKGTTPLTLAKLADALARVDDKVKLPERDMFVVAEGEKLQSDSPKLSLNARLVYTWRRDSSAGPDVMLSTVPDRDSPSSLLQLIAWSNADGAFHYFERIQGLGWVWAGNSFHALRKPSRGEGPFDSHVNGSLVMKELKIPWVHWNSFAAGINTEIVFPSQKDRESELFKDVGGADRLEGIVKNGISQWTKSRITADIVSNRLTHFRDYARQILTTTSVNLVSSSKSHTELEQADLAVDLPITFFLDADALAFLFDTPVLAPSLNVNAQHYTAAAASLGLHIIDGTGARVERETHFVFVVPERAFEDILVERQLRAKSIISQKLALCLHMVDFPNAVFSSRRAALLRHFPNSTLVDDAGTRLESDVLESMGSIPTQGSAEEEFLRWWHEPNLQEAAQRAITSYLQHVEILLTTEPGVNSVLRLAESRRQRFRKRRLAEFPQSTSKLNDPVPALMMTVDAIVTTET